MKWNAVWKVLELVKNKMIIYNDSKNIWLYGGKLLTMVFNASKSDTLILSSRDNLQFLIFT